MTKQTEIYPFSITTISLTVVGSLDDKRLVVQGVSALFEMEQ